MATKVIILFAWLLLMIIIINKYFLCVQRYDAALDLAIVIDT
jgi:hypothetical protein